MKDFAKFSNMNSHLQIENQKLRVEMAKVFSDSQITQGSL